MTASWRETVAEALAEHRVDRFGNCACGARIPISHRTQWLKVSQDAITAHVADALAPTIERLLTEARAEALREAATSLGHIHQADSAGASACIRWLRDRAASIARTAASTEEER